MIVLKKADRSPISNVMLRITPILLAVLVGFGFYWFSSLRMKRTLDTQSTELDDPEIGRLTRQLAHALDLPRIKVQVYEVDVVNGLAAPDGRVFITRGFLNKYKLGEVTAAEITSVVAHELGHVALGHSRRRMIDFSAQNAIRTMLAMVLGRFIPFLGVYIANGLTQLIAARLSRSDEYEADAYAAALLTKAGLSTAPQISLFEKLDGMSPKGQPLAWLMSHPKTEDRIAAIRQLEHRWAES